MAYECQLSLDVFEMGHSTTTIVGGVEWSIGITREQVHPYPSVTLLVLHVFSENRYRC